MSLRERALVPFEPVVVMSVSVVAPQRDWTAPSLECTIGQAPVHVNRDLYISMRTSNKKPPAPPPDPEQLVGFWINLASRTIVRVLDDRLRPLGFAMSHLPVLRALAQRGALSQKELAHIARVEQQTMAELLTRMERAGLVEREPNPADKRGSLISLSRDTTARFSKAAKALQEGERQATAGFSDEEKALFAQFLKRVIKNLEA